MNALRTFLWVVLAVAGLSPTVAAVQGTPAPSFVNAPDQGLLVDEDRPGAA